MVSQLLRFVGQGLNYDFCPSLNAYFYWLKRPVGWVICAILFSALVGLLIGPQGFILMWSMIAFLVVGAIWPWCGMKGISCRLEFYHSHSEEQEPTSARLIVTNSWPIPVFGLTVEGQFLQDIFEDDDKVALGLTRIPAWSESEYKWEFKPTRRGILPQEAPVVATGFPFGIYQSRKTIPLDRQIIVWPRRESLSSVRELDGINFNIEGGFCDSPGHDGDVIGTRAYRHSDSIKHVNWSKTASTGRLVVLERQTAAQRSIRVIVDLDPRHHHGFGSHGSYECAIRIAATIVNHLHLHQSHIQLTCTGTPAVVPSDSSNAQGLKPILDFLATLPTFEQLDSYPKNDLNGAASLSLRNQEEVFWISSRSALPSRAVAGKANRIHEILLDTPSTEVEQSPNDSHGTDDSTRIVIDTVGSLQNQIQHGWERLCCDS